MLTACQHLKLPWSLFGKSTHPSVVTQTSWMNDWHIPFVPYNYSNPSFLRYGYLKIWPWKSKVKYEVICRGQIVGPVPNQPINECTFCFISIGPIIPKIWPIECLTVKKKTSEILTTKTAKKVSKKFFINSIRWVTWLGGYIYQVLHWLDEWFALYGQDKQIFIK